MALVQFNTLAVAGGNLFAIAAAQYGDALQWSRIAELNGVWCPWLDSTTPVLKLPGPAAAAELTGGLIGAPY